MNIGPDYRPQRAAREICSRSIDLLEEVSVSLEFSGNSFLPNRKLAYQRSILRLVADVRQLAEYIEREIQAL